ncbi:MAG: hypothetical protein EA424_21535 [Planctomycetaceae bacterium]|jgi:hypothetical protein|nr:MAG: hypothetical protein EA424_21535 [Planctomycetaceae bacterium]
MNRVAERRYHGRRHRQPWGRASAFLAASFSALIGVWCGLEPDVILGRALITGAFIGLAVWATATLFDSRIRWQGR